MKVIGTALQTSKKIRYVKVNMPKAMKTAKKQAKKMVKTNKLKKVKSKY